MINFIFHFFGLDNGSGPFYLFWSGIGSDLSEIVLLAPLYGIYRKHQCHVSGCWRIARHPVDGSGVIVCAKHHPDGAPSAQDIKEMM